MTSLVFMGLAGVGHVLGWPGFLVTATLGIARVASGIAFIATAALLLVGTLGFGTAVAIPMIVAGLDEIIAGAKQARSGVETPSPLEDFLIGLGFPDLAASLLVGIPKLLLSFSPRSAMGIVNGFKAVIFGKLKSIEDMLRALREVLNNDLTQKALTNSRYAAMRAAETAAGSSFNQAQWLKANTSSLDRLKDFFSQVLTGIGVGGASGSGPSLASGLAVDLTKFANVITNTLAR